MVMTKKVLMGLAASMVLAAGSALAGERHVVTASVTSFNPAVIFIQPGDTVVWENMAGHDTVSLEGMIPEGAADWQSAMGENYSHTFEAEGAYVYKCSPHVSMGMLGAVVVGDKMPDNIEDIRNHPENKGMIGRAVRNLDKALGERFGDAAVAAQ